jgi:2-succinyl-5-enolpyruvyl-6-hydroxy-3-cyclohexene-1-carboxylate synthase
MSDAADNGLLNLRWAQTLVDALAAAGLRAAVLSPGSRSTPLALAFLRQTAVRCQVIVDERSAAFVALGMAKATRQPVALLCTSGSAPANWFPALIEADLGAVPLLLLTADRPPELLGWGANQTIDQQHLFGRHVRSFYAPPLPAADFSPAYLQRLAARAIADSGWPLPGPVHLNLAFREPLLPAGELLATHAAAACSPAVSVAAPLLLPRPQAIAATLAEISGRPGAIVCGGADYPPQFAAAVSALAAQLDCPILAEPLSNLRFAAYDRSRLCVRYESFLRPPSPLATARPEWLLRFGAFPVTRTLQEWLRAAASALQVVVTPGQPLAGPAARRRQAAAGRSGRGLPSPAGRRRPARAGQLARPFCPRRGGCRSRGTSPLRGCRRAAGALRRHADSGAARTPAGGPSRLLRQLAGDPRPRRLFGKRSGGSGGENRKPCWIGQPLASRKSACARVSTPSATTRMPNWCPSSMIDSAIAASLPPRVTSVTKARSIFSSSSGKRLR